MSLPSSSSSSPLGPPPIILYACIVRQACPCCCLNSDNEDENENDETLLLAHDGAQNLVQQDVNFTALELLQQKSNLGFDSFDAKPRFRRRRGLKFHVYQKEQHANDDSFCESPVHVYAYACVYDTKRCSKAVAQAFLIKLVEATKESRLHSDDWRSAQTMLACQDSCGPLLQQHMDEAFRLASSPWMKPVVVIEHATPANTSKGDKGQSPSPERRMNAAVTSNAMAKAREIMLQNRSVMDIHTAHKQSNHESERSLPMTPSQIIIDVNENSMSHESDSMTSHLSTCSPEMSLQIKTESLNGTHLSPIMLPDVESDRSDEFALSPRSIMGDQSTPTSAMSNHSADEHLGKIQELSTSKKMKIVIGKNSQANDAVFSTFDDENISEPVRSWWWCLSLGGTNQPHAIRKEPTSKFSTTETDAEDNCFLFSSIFSPRPSLVE